MLIGFELSVVGSADGFRLEATAGGTTLSCNDEVQLEERLLELHQFFTEYGEDITHEAMPVVEPRSGITVAS